MDEEEYLLQSIVKMCSRLGNVQGTRGNAKDPNGGHFLIFLRVLVFSFLGEAGKLLPHMLQFTDEHREEGKALQAELVSFQDELSKAIEEVWTRPSGTESKDVTAVPPGAGEAAKPQDPQDKIAKPQIVEPTWRVTLWDRKRL